MIGVDVPGRACMFGVCVRGALCVNGSKIGCMSDKAGVLGGT